MGKELRLEEMLQHSEEGIGAFYIRNCLALHSTIAKSADVVDKVHKIIQNLNPNRDKYAEMIFVLRNIRESYKITQGEMARLMNRKQSVISKFESGNLNVRFDFFLIYAGILGYKISTNMFSGNDEITKLYDRQAQMVKVLSLLSPLQRANKYLSGLHLKTKWPEDAAKDSIRGIMFNLNIAKHCVNNEPLTMYQEWNKLPRDQRERTYDLLPDKLAELTPKSMKKRLKVSERTIRRFESETDYMPSASLVFRYASIVKVGLELECEKNSDDCNETYGAFYLRRIFLLHDWLRILSKDPGA